MSESQVRDLLGCIRVIVAKQQTPGALNQNSEESKIQVSSDHNDDQELSSGPSLDDPEVKTEEEDEQRTTQITIRPWFEDDGLRTPTSSDCRIPETKQCPPAPRKPRRQHPMKRTAASFPDVRRCLQLVQFQEVEQLFIFPPIAAGQFHCKIKRARMESMEKIAETLETGE